MKSAQSILPKKRDPVANEKSIIDLKTKISHRSLIKTADRFSGKNRSFFLFHRNLHP